MIHSDDINQVSKDMFQDYPNIVKDIKAMEINISHDCATAFFIGAMTMYQLMKNERFLNLKPSIN